MNKLLKGCKPAFLWVSLFLGMVVTPAFGETANTGTETPAFDNAEVLDSQQIDMIATNGILAQMQSGRALVVEELNGKVMINGRPAQVGDRLAAQDVLMTDVDSTARLRVDSFIGVVEVAELSTLEIQTLSGPVGVNPNQVTALAVPRGRVRLSIARSVARPARNSGVESQEVAGLPTLTGLGINNLSQDSTTVSSSPVRVRTPAGVAGVSGTSFGVDVSSTGKTGADTIDGQVAVAGQNRQVLVNRGFFTVINPGEAPVSPLQSPTISDLKMFRVLKLGRTSARIIGQVDPMDLVYVDNVEIPTDAEGKFNTIVHTPPSRRIKVVVRGPSVRERYYIIALD
ncbi:hypothetical protein NG798_14750 [Ancylothrix sp. C2]|uniref:hypothetical protein n=1 Tax=Ancylothrix sp. D3o TaxID=2953691 RepID=UPI0021BA488B|nr:hypothetical protein [Ancylothrix sp. D3o]MCT7951055.1 hypothetical protein [Ancylothrix sp. D3o]